MLGKLLVPTLIIFLIIFIINIFMVKLTGPMIYSIPEGSSYYHVSGNGHAGYIPGDSLLRTDAKDLIGLGHFYHYKAFWFSERALYSAILMG